ncbi:DUF58 domain-containing protein, partial [Streptomyces sp. NPDC059233]
HSDGTGISRAHDALRGAGQGGGFGGDGLLVAFFGDLDDVQTELAARMRQRAGAAVAFVLDSATWAGEPALAQDLPSPAERLRRLRDAGWTAVAVPPGAAFGELWRHAGAAPLGTATSGGRG